MKELYHNSSRYWELWRNLPHLAWMHIDAHGSIHMASRGVGELLGLPPMEIEGRSVASLFAPQEQRSELAEAHLVLACSEGATSFRAQLMGNHGRAINVDLCYYSLAEVMPVASSRGGAAAVLAFVRPVSSELRQGSVLIRELSHKIRTPLSVMGLSANLLRDYIDRMTAQERRDEIAQINAGIAECQRLLAEALQQANGSTASRAKVDREELT
jgi:PAS domain S-box-containing protein